jgi:hypothetical protein
MGLFCSFPLSISCVELRTGRSRAIVGTINQSDVRVSKLNNHDRSELLLTRIANPAEPVA